jgi:hypothetical protein
MMLSFSGRFSVRLAAKTGSRASLFQPKLRRESRHIFTPFLFSNLSLKLVPRRREPKPRRIAADLFSMPPKKCEASKSDGSRCKSEAKHPEEDPVVCGNHLYKLDEDGTFDDNRKKNPATPAKPVLAVKREINEEMAEMLANLVDEDAANLAFKAVEQKNKVVVEISFKKSGEAPSPQILQALEEKDAKIAALEAKLAALAVAPK